MADLYLDHLDQWHEMVEKGLTTFAEKPDPTRSDCHAWSASPNYDLLATVCGIRPSEPGFKSVVIEPHLGRLSEVEGKLYMPAYHDHIKVNLTKNGESGISGMIELPGNLQGTFRWNGQVIPLSGGRQTIEIK